MIALSFMSEVWTLGVRSMCNAGKFVFVGEG